MTPTSSTPRPADQTQYFTYRNPQDYIPNWREFYDRAAAARDEMITSFRSDLTVPYGSDERQLMNIYRPEVDEGPRPVLLYFHGGRWREGHPDFYDHLGRPWVDDGAVFISCGYRLEPAATIADSVDDVGAAIRWIVEHAPEYAIDPERVTVVGHSAGAHIAVMACLTDWNDADFPKGGSVANVWAMSGPMDLSGRGMAQTDATDPIQRLRTGTARVLVSFGEPEDNRRCDDAHQFARDGRALVAALTDLGVTAREVVAPDTDHIASATLLAEQDGPFYPLAAEAVFGPDRHDRR